MFIVYVKHYLTTEGIAFFHQDWLPRVKSIMSQQIGYVAVIHDANNDNDDCVNVIVKFENEETLNSWAAHPDHEYLVNALDLHRSRSYWEVACVANDDTPHSIAEWEKIIPSTQAAAK